MMNEYEKACLEWLKGCSCADFGKPEECEECTTAFLNHIKDLGKKIEFCHVCKCVRGMDAKHESFCSVGKA